jgi:PAS domain S-box-containing protein
MAEPTDPFVGTGEVRSIARATDWTGTPLGPVESWSRTLRDAVRSTLASPFPINLWCGPDLVLIYNDAYRDVLGAKHPWSFGRSGREVWSEIWPEIAPMFERIRADGPPVYQEDAPFYVRRAGEEAGAEGDARHEPNAWFTFSLSPVRDPEGGIVAFMNIVSESTRRVLAERAQTRARADAERAEARLREVFSQAPAFMAVLRGPSHVFEYVNAAYSSLVGNRELIGLPVMEALPEVRGQGFEELLDQVLETGKPYVGREVSILLERTSGEGPEERFLDFVYYPITESNGRRTGVVVHGSDVTEHVLSRRETQRARAEAERANLAKSQFLATMSHEIRTPINAVMGYTDLLDAGVAGSLSAEQQGYVDAIAASSRHLLGLVSDILDLAKIEAGEMQIRAHETIARSAVSAAVQLVTPRVRARGLELKETWACDDGTTVLGDEDRIRQILLNLLSNAIKFTDSGGVISIHCRIVDVAAAYAALPEMGPWFVVDVEDTGRGIPSDHLGRVFEPFIQVDAGHTRQVGGSGLGLTISRRLARLMGGELTVRSELGAGSKFSLWLPAAVQEERRRAEDDSVEKEGDVDPGPWPPPPLALPGLASAGRALLSVVVRVEDRWVERLRSDSQLGAIGRLNDVQLRDHTAELVTGIAKTLFVLEEGRGEPALLRDAEMILHLIARRHGLQRRRLGWGRSELRREYQILGEVLDVTLRSEAPKRTAADVVSALDVVARIVDRAARASLSAFEDAGGEP